MRLLLLSHRPAYPPHRGDSLTVYGFLRALHETHQITLVCADDSGDLSNVGALSSLAEDVAVVPIEPKVAWARAGSGLFSRMPSQVHYFRSATLAREVSRRHAAQPFDVYIAHSLRMAPHIAALRPRRSVLWLVDSIGRELGASLRHIPGWRRLAVRWERHRVDRFSAVMASRFSETWVASEADRDDLIRLGCPRVELVPIGIEPELFDVEHVLDSVPRVGFLGNLSVRHNTDALRFLIGEIWPDVVREVPGAALSVRGARPFPWVRKLCEAPSVRLEADTKDLKPWWSSLRLLLAPVRFSAGVQTKVLEAMAATVPVVTTSSVANALGPNAADFVVIADTAESLAAATVKCLRHPAAGTARTRRARDYVRARFTWDIAGSRLRRLEALDHVEGAG